jgi:hypothetical protein
LRPRQRNRVTAISAKMPPSPWLSARITNQQYLTEMVIMSAQKIRDRLPSAADRSSVPPVAWAIALNV